MAVDAAERQRGRVDDLAHRRERVARRDREAELRTLGAGLDVLVGVRLDTGGRRARTPARRTRAARAGRARRTSRRRRPDAGVAGRARSPRRSCCCRGTRGARPGSRAASATCSSPPVATSSLRPSSATSRAIARQRNALPAYATLAGPKLARELAAAGPQVVLVVDEQRACRTRPRARRGRGRAGRAGRATGRTGASGGVDRHVRLRPRRRAAPSPRARSRRGCPSASASPIRHASVSQSRAWVSAASSVMHPAVAVEAVEP